MILLVIVFVAINLFSDKGGTPSDTTGQETIPKDAFGLATSTLEELFPVANTPSRVVIQSATRTPVRTPAKPAPNISAPRTGGKTWTVMLYQDADDPVLEQDISMDLNEAERVGSSDQVNVVVQIDRYAGAYQGDGDWTGTRRYYLTPDNDLFHLHSKMVADLGEVSMADPRPWWISLPGRSKPTLRKNMP